MPTDRAKYPTKSTRFAYKGHRLKPLRAFCQVAKLGSVSRAAESLYLTQPAVSLQLQALEREFGVELLRRQGRHLVLTREGTLLYDMAKPLVDGLDALESEFRKEIKGMAAGELNVAAGTSTAMYLLPDIVERFKKAHPDIKFNLHNVTGAQGMELLRNGKVDLAVGSMIDVPHDLDYAKVYQYDMHLITHPEHELAQEKPITLEKIAKHGLILPPQRLTSYRLIDLVFAQKHLPLDVILEVGGWEIIKEYVASGIGISVVTGICLTERDRHRLFRYSLKDFFPPRSYGVIVRKGKFLSAQARAFVDQIHPGLFQRMDYYSTGQSER